MNLHKKREEEALLWLQFKKGDKDAFAILYKTHILSLIAYGSKLCTDKEALKDAIHELFVELWNSRSNLADTDSVTFYLIKALRYKLIRLEKQRHIQTRVPAANFNKSHFEDPIEASIIERETLDSNIAHLRKAIQALTTRQQEVIQLRFYQGFSNEQIAEIMSMHYQSVSNLLYNALCRLKETIKNPDFIAAIPLISLFFI